MSKPINFVVIETARACEVDVGVVAVLWEYIVTNNCLRTSKYQQGSPCVAVLATDVPPRTLHQSCRQLSLPQRNLIDGYSQWYPLNLSESKPPSFPIVHIASSKSDDYGQSTDQSDTLAAIADAIASVLNRVRDSDASERIVVLDSLTSILRFHPDLSSFLKLRDTLNHSVNRPARTPLTILCTIRTEETDQALAASLVQLADTHARVCQSSSENSHVRNLVWTDVRRRKPSGRVVFEKIEASIDHSRGYCQLSDVRVSALSDSVIAKSASNTKTLDSALELAQRGLTFRIGLSSKEREMRAAAGLPYLHQDEALADSALEFHPKHLQLSQPTSVELESANDGDDDDSADDDDVEFDDEGELFSEDV